MLLAELIDLLLELKLVLVHHSESVALQLAVLDLVPQSDLVHQLRRGTGHLLTVLALRVKIFLFLKFYLREVFEAV